MLNFIKGIILAVKIIFFNGEETQLDEIIETARKVKVSSNTESEYSKKIYRLKKKIVYYHFNETNGAIKNTLKLKESIKSLTFSIKDFLLQGK